MSATGGSLPPIKKRSLYDAPPHGASAKGPGSGPGPGESTDDGWGSVSTKSKVKGGPFSLRSEERRVGTEC
jgi:hypothetical protein